MSEAFRTRKAREWQRENGELYYGHDSLPSCMHMKMHSESGKQIYLKLTTGEIYENTSG